MQKRTKYGEALEFLRTAIKDPGEGCIAAMILGVTGLEK